MKTKVILTTLLLCISFLKTFAQEIATVEEISIDSKILNQTRPVLIYTPKNYVDKDLVSYDIIYVFDSQNRELFDFVHSSLNFITSRKFIVIGIASPAYEELKYYRNDDMLPKPVYVSLDESYLASTPNSENFWKFITEELTPFIENKYRTTNRRFAIGHSLSASFVLDKAINDPDLIEGYISVSPNFAYDDFRLAKDFINFGFDKAFGPKFIYISQANEMATFSESWRIGYEKIKTFIGERERIGNYTISLEEFPNNDHWDTYPVSINSGLQHLLDFIKKHPYLPNGAFREVVFTVSVPNKEDEVYIVGNQKSLGEWNPSKVKMVRTSDFEREIKLNVQFPLEFKITRGSWESEAFTNQSSNDADNILIQKMSGNKIQLKVEGWMDREF